VVTFIIADLQIDSMLARCDEEAAAFAAAPLSSPAKRVAGAEQCKPMIEEMRAAHTVQPVAQEPMGRGMRRR
jgi:hypothetical protein